MNKKTQNQKNFTRISNTGPFRGILLTFHKNTNFESLQESLVAMTFKHPNFFKSNSDKSKCIIYYKHPYDAATVIEKYCNNLNFSICIYEDEISKTLSPNILYIQSSFNIGLSKLLSQLQGVIIYKGKDRIQVKFKNFKTAAIAQEEIGKEYKTKFCYISEVSDTKPKKPSTNNFSELEKISENITTLIENNPESISTIKNNLALAMETLKIKEMEFNREKIRATAENLDLANVSWDDQINLEESLAEYQNPETNSEGASKLITLIKNIIEKKKC